MWSLSSRKGGGKALVAGPFCGFPNRLQQKFLLISKIVGLILLHESDKMKKFLSLHFVCKFIFVAKKYSWF